MSNDVTIRGDLIWTEEGRKWAVTQIPPMPTLTPGYEEMRDFLMGRLSIPRHLATGRTMTEHDWLTSTDSVAMLHLVTGFHGNERSGGFQGVSPRKLRLFAVACCRAVWDGTKCSRCKGCGILVYRTNAVGIVRHEKICPDCVSGRIGGLTDPRSRRAVEVAERYVDGLATEKELSAAHDEADFSLDNLVIHAADCACMGAFDAASDISILPTATQASLLRCIVGNPWRPVRLCGNLACVDLEEGYHDSNCWMKNSTVLAVAQSIYEEKRWQDTPILADALEDAGCANADILDHLRGDGPHARGCHVVDAILGKELHRD